jgi:hypothetical protein
LNNIDKNGVTPFAFAKKSNKHHSMELLKKYGGAPEDAIKN